jgi:DNA-binding GntR family transcriptional regulator
MSDRGGGSKGLHGRLADEVYEQLVAALLEGTIVAGDRLVQDRLAEDFEVSRTPVRDALLRLNEEGVIRPSGRRGYVVLSLGSDDVDNIYEARYAVEGHAASIVAARGAETLDCVRATLDKLTASSATRTPFDANRAMHRAIVEASGNPPLLGFFDAIWGRVLTTLAYNHFSVEVPYEECIADHERLIEKLGQADAEAARETMIAHIRRWRGTGAGRRR